MKVQRFVLQGEPSARLELRWEGLHAHVYLDGVQTATLDGPRGLKQGWSTQLEDGSTVEIRAIRRLGFSELSVLKNGEHVLSSPSHPDRILATSCNVLFVLSAFLIATGLLGVTGRIWVDALFGLFYLVGALLLRARRRLGALVVAVPLILKLDFLLVAALAGQVDRGWWLDLILNLMFFWFVARSYQAVRDSRRLRAHAATAA